MRIAVHDYAGHPFQFDLSRALAARGHMVRHFFFAGDAGPKGHTTLLPGDPATLSIVPISVPLRYSKSGLLQRFVGDKLYGAAVAARLRAFQPDVVISGNTPPNAQRTLQRAARACGSRFVFWVQDFYSIGIERMLRGRWSQFGRLVIRYYKSLEMGMLERSDAVVLISPDFRRYLPPGVHGDKVHVIRNWGMLDTVRRADKDNAWSRRHGLADGATFMYTGTLGLKHDPNLLLALADAFADDLEVKVAVIASGASADALRSQNAAAPRPNLVMLPLQPIEELSDVLGTADVLVTLLGDDGGQFSVPSKLLSYLCAGRAVLLSAPPQNLATALLQESGAGLASPANDTKSFLAAARRLRADAVLREALGRRGRSYAEAHFDIDDIARRFERVFRTAIEPCPVSEISAQTI